MTVNEKRDLIQNKALQAVISNNDVGTTLLFGGLGNIFVIY